MLSAVFSGSETALFTVGLVRVKTLAKRKPAAALIEKMRENPRRLLGALLLGNNLVNISASALMTVIVMDAFGSAAVAIATGAMTLVILIFGEFLPKSYAAQHSEKIALAVARPVHWLTVAVGPLVRLLDIIVNAVIRRESGTTAPFVSEEEIKTMAGMAVKAGTVEKGERDLIEKVFLMNDITASDVMTPRESVVFLDASRSLAEAMPLITDGGFSRYPVFGKSKNDIIGIALVKDMFQKIAENPSLPLAEIKLKELAEPAPFVPNTKPIDDLMRDMQKQHVHMAVVVNEFGTVVGIVTFEDLVEELVGEIADESDVDDLFVKRIDKMTVMASGDAEIKDINKFFNVKIPGPPHKTLGWAMLKECGSIPPKGQQVRLAESLNAVVEEMINLRIHKVRLIKTGESPDAQNVP
jgi:CBS domain containing-hemolysin-like protein